MSEYEISDSGGLEMLQQACAACDRAEMLASEIALDGGPVIRTRGVIRDHPRNTNWPPEPLSLGRWRGLV